MLAEQVQRQLDSKVPSLPVPSFPLGKDKMEALISPLSLCNAQQGVEARQVDAFLFFSAPSYVFTVINVCSLKVYTHTHTRTITQYTVITVNI